MRPDKTLGELGEMRLIEEVISPIARRYEAETLIGDDCAYIEVGAKMLAVSADVGPNPLIRALPGYEDDLEAAGWLAAVATASDVATAGARPLFLANCIDAPPETSVEDFSTYIDGYFRACSTLGFRNAGGDVRHGPKLAIRVFGAGAVEGRAIGRGGVCVGDHIVAIGPTGEFMASYLLARDRHPTAVVDDLLSQDILSTLRFPMPKLREMQILAAHGLVSAASDTSDGLIGALDNLVRRSCCAIELELHAALLPQTVQLAAQATGFSAWNIFSCWGDWSIAAAIPTSGYDRFTALCDAESISWIPLGRATNGSGLRAKLHHRDYRVEVIRNENFVSRGFNAGLSGHLSYMLETDIFRPL